MDGRSAVLLGMGVMLASGCSSMSAGKGYERMQTQVQLLDERLTQLERSSSRGPSAEFSPEDPGFTGAALMSEPAASSTSAAPSPKPSTRQIQAALKNAGLYEGAVDGKMGPATRSAVREFQRVNGLKADGVVGRRTWAKLSAYTEVAAPPPSGELGASEILK